MLSRKRCRGTLQDYKKSIWILHKQQKTFAALRFTVLIKQNIKCVTRQINTPSNTH